MATVVQGSRAQHNHLMAAIQTFGPPSQHYQWHTEELQPSGRPNGDEFRYLGIGVIASGEAYLHVPSNTTYSYDGAPVSGPNVLSPSLQLPDDTLAFLRDWPFGIRPDVAYVVDPFDQVRTQREKDEVMRQQFLDMPIVKLESDRSELHKLLASLGKSKSLPSNKQARIARVSAASD